MAEGQIKWYSQQLGHGFIVWEDQFGDVFVRSQDVKGDPFSLDTGDRVTFDVVDGLQGKEARNVSKHPDLVNGSHAASRRDHEGGDPSQVSGPTPDPAYTGPGPSEEGRVDYDEFVGQVQSLGELGSRGEAERAIRAVLAAIGEYLEEGEADNLASRLPREVSEHLRGERTQHNPALFLPMFQGRVGELAGVGAPKYSIYTAAVSRVLRDTVPPDNLPGKLGPLFSFGD